MTDHLTPGLLAKRLESKFGPGKVKTGKLSRELFSIISRELKTRDSFSLFGFGTFKKIPVAAGKGRNPHTGEEIDIAAHFRIKFTPSHMAAERINAKNAHLRPQILENIMDNEQKKLERQESQGRAGKRIYIILIVLFALLLVLGLSLFLMRRGFSKMDSMQIVTAEDLMAPAAAEPEELVPVAKDAPKEASQAVRKAETPDVHYSIVSGDSLSLIAQGHWGNIDLWPWLYRYNSKEIPDPDLIRVGKKIVVPPQPDKQADQAVLEDSILFAYKRYRELIARQSDSPRNSRRELHAAYTLLGGEKLYPSFLNRHKNSIDLKDIRRIENLAPRE